MCQRDPPQKNPFPKALDCHLLEGCCNRHEHVQPRWGRLALWRPVPCGQMDGRGDSRWGTASVTSVAWVSPTVLQNWHVGNSSDRASPILGSPPQITDMETSRRLGVRGSDGGAALGLALVPQASRRPPACQQRKEGGARCGGAQEGSSAAEQQLEMCSAAEMVCE